MTCKEIQRILREKNITQKDLAKKAGVSEVSISHFLRRKFKSRKLSAVVNETIGVEGAI